MAEKLAFDKALGEKNSQFYEQVGANETLELQLKRANDQIAELKAKLEITPVDKALDTVNHIFLTQLRDDIDLLSKWQHGIQGRNKIKEIQQRMTLHGYPRKPDQPAEAEANTVTEEA